MDFKFSLDSQEDEVFDKNDDNILKVSVTVAGVPVENKDNCFVFLDMTRDAMIGLGVELIRKAMESDLECGYCELYPVRYPLRRMGVYLHPDSCRLFLGMAAEFSEKFEEMFPDD